MTNAPSADWYFVEVKRHINPGNFYEVQTAHAMTGANTGTIYERVQQSGSAGIGWGAWVKSGGGGKQLTSSISGIYANSSTYPGVYQPGVTGTSFGFTLTCVGQLTGRTLIIDGAMNIFANGVYLGNIASGSLYFGASPYTDRLQITPTGIMDSSTCYNGGAGTSTGFFAWLS